jgi:outer membrane protein OmpA-like peptidoglycan-associated protein
VLVIVAYTFWPRQGGGPPGNRPGGGVNSASNNTGSANINQGSNFTEGSVADAIWRRLDAGVAYERNELPPGSKVDAPIFKEVAEGIAEVVNTKKVRVTVEVHTDLDGVPKPNLDRSQSRATALCSLIRERSAAAAERVTCIGLGEAFPVVGREGALDEMKFNRRLKIVRQ